MAVYVDNGELLAEVIESKKRMRSGMAPGEAITPRMAAMFKLMVDRYGKRSNFAGYSYIDEMRADALLQLCMKWHKFDETRFSNPFAYYTTIIHMAFLGGLGREKKQQAIRDDLLEANGLAASSKRQLENEMAMRNADAQAEHMRSEPEPEVPALPDPKPPKRKPAPKKPKRVKKPPKEKKPPLTREQRRALAAHASRMKIVKMRAAGWVPKAERTPPKLKRRHYTAEWKAKLSESVRRTWARKRAEAAEPK